MLCNVMLNKAFHPNCTWYRRNRLGPSCKN